MKKAIASFMALAMTTMSMLMPTTALAATSTTYDVEGWINSNLPEDTVVAASGYASTEWEHPYYVIDLSDAAPDLSGEVGYFELELTGAEWLLATGSMAGTTYNAGTKVWDHDASAATAPQTFGDVDFAITVDPVNKNLARIDLSNQDLSGGAAVIAVPLAFTTDDDDTEVTARITYATPGLTVRTGSVTKKPVVTPRGTGTGKYYVTVPKVPSSQYSFFIEEIRVVENVYGTIQDGDVLTITAPKGYTFLKNTGSIASQVVFGGGFAYDSAATASAFTVGQDDDERELKVTVDLTNVPGKTTATTGPGVISIKNVTLVANNTNLSDLDTSGNLVAKYEINGGDEEEFTIAKVVERNLTYALEDTTKAVPTLVTGRMVPDDMTKGGTNDFTKAGSVHKTAPIIFKENSPNSWLSEGITKFTLPEGVKFLKAELRDGKNLSAQTYSSSGLPSLLGKSTVVNSGEIPGTRSISINENVLTISGVKKSGTANAGFVLDMWVSIDPEFAPADGSSQDVEVKVSGSGIREELSTIDPVVVAKAVRPVTVDTKVTNIKIGYQVIPTADITIKENAAGYLLKDTVLALGNEGLDGIDVNTKNIKAEVTEGNIQISKVAIAANGAGVTSGYGYRIEKASSKASTLKLSNVAITINRSVPYSNDHNYEIYVGGTAVAANYVYNYYTATNGIATIKYLSRFTTPGIGVEYLNVVTPSTDVQAEEVRVKIGSSTYVKNGKEVAMPDGVAAYLSTESDSTMVPVRFVANALGVDDDSVVWDGNEKTVTILTPSKTVQFTQGSSKMLVNGTAVTMITENGKEIKAENKDGRVYVPFKKMAQAFGVNVTWDDETKTAIFNPSK